MHFNEQLIQTFYTCFQNRDAPGMATCYHADVVFSDPVFPHLAGKQAVAMWRMFCARAEKSGLQVSFTDVQADDQAGRAHWEAHYTFSQTGRHVHNRIDATFAFRDGNIIRHTDSFDLWKWAAMALGLRGQLLGWTPVVQSAIRKNASRGLEAFIQKQV